MGKLTKIRQDAWSHEDDLLLAETVLRHIREGSTQLKAFDEVGDQLNRTSAACGFRWNAEIRNKYIEAIELAKKQRKEQKRKLASIQTKKHSRTTVSSAQENKVSTSQAENRVDDLADINLEQIITYLKNLKVHDMHHLETLKRENTALKSKTYELEEQLLETQSKLKAVQSDYQYFLHVMEKARQLTTVQSQQEPTTQMFYEQSPNMEEIIRESN